MTKVNILLRLFLFCIAIHASSSSLMAVEPGFHVSTTLAAASPAVDLKWLFVKCGIFVLVEAAMFLFVFWALFRILVVAGKWPQDAYSWCWITMLIFSVAYLIYMFYLDLTIPPGTEDWQRWGIEVSLGLVTVGLIVYVWTFIKTPKARKNLLLENKSTAKKP